MVLDEPPRAPPPARPLLRPQGNHDITPRAPSLSQARAPGAEWPRVLVVSTLIRSLGRVASSSWAAVPRMLGREPLSVTSPSLHHLPCPAGRPGDPIQVAGPRPHFLP